MTKEEIRTICEKAKLEVRNVGLGRTVLQTDIELRTELAIARAALRIMCAEPYPYVPSDVKDEPDYLFQRAIRIARENLNG